ncbi:hypothetical protein BO94DRAFT_611231 [Aspergillus sclerotioniger CBS 115572]|uniref:Ankyrin n=1 Tax=Aspergillus sclerotioniger CBS 115572 TaxID=1450535 RepID=A0A317VAJ7_9EURO|nr:hypothetical protein BO94DRAFT_611231 [Aspergillus sclerotioniger CBS 115572]PWY68960.1 hypothetical protein BO94DRAFT_611231 [Aspergillus sclerotioniger CBS 115572]
MSDLLLNITTLNRTYIELARQRYSLKRKICLVGYGGEELCLTREVYPHADADGDQKHVTEFLLRQEATCVVVTDASLVRVSRSSDIGLATMTGRRTEETKLTVNLLSAAKDNFYDGRKVISVLRQEIVELYTTESGLKAAGADPAVMLFLLTQKEVDFKITERVLLSAAQNHEVMELLFSYGFDHLLITEEVIIAASRSPRVMSLLMEKLGNEITITEELLLATSKKSNSLHILLRWMPDGFKFTERGVLAIAEVYGIKDLPFARQGSMFKITEETLLAAISHWHMMNLLLKVGGFEIHVTERVLTAAAPKFPIVELLLEHGGDEAKGNFTENVLKAIYAAAGADPRDMHLLVKLQSRYDWYKFAKRGTDPSRFPHLGQLLRAKTE